MSAVALTDAFDWKSANYDPIIAERIRRLKYIRANPGVLPGLRAFYREDLVQFIVDWAVTVDPRHAGTRTPVVMPFVPFPRQLEWMRWQIQNWRDGQPSVTEKSRDVGVSWMAVMLSCALCLFNENLTIGFGSQFQNKVDQIGDPNALFPKARAFMSHLPREFRGTWDLKRDAPFMRVIFPDSRSAIIGECGDSIGRGGRTSIFWVDEAAHLEHPKLVDASLIATTNSRFDMSSVYGNANPFAEKARSGKYRTFRFHWTQDPRKDQVWYENLKARTDPITIAQEYDIDYSASVEGIVIPSLWVQAAVDAHKKLGIEPTGRKFSSFDVADGGQDLCAFAGRHGFRLTHLHSWSGKASDIFASTVKVFGFCDDYGYDRVSIDVDGLGAGASGDSRVINEERQRVGKRTISVSQFRGSGEIERPDAEFLPGRANRDYFANRKAQAWFELRERFKKTYAAVVEGKPFDPDEMISIDSSLPELNTLLRELSQPTFHLNTAGKILIDKAPDGARSPNLGDAVMMCFAANLSTVELYELLGQ